MTEKCKRCGQEVVIADGDRIKICIGGHTHITVKEHKEKMRRRKERQQNDM